MAKKGFTVHIDEQVIDDFRRYCNLNALKVSAKVELILKKEIENAKINPTLVEMFKKILEGQKILRAQKSDGQTKVNDVGKEIYKEMEEIAKIDSSVKIETKEIKEKKQVPTIQHLKRMKEI